MTTHTIVEGSLFCVERSTPLASVFSFCQSLVYTCLVKSSVKEMRNMGLGDLPCLTNAVHTKTGEQEKVRRSEGARA